jgi:hypothetical protein
MEIAVFTESYEPTMGAKRRQVLMAPYDGSVRIWSRVTDGVKGPHNKWEETDLSELVELVNENESLTRTPVAVYVTAADEKAIAEKGYSPVLGTKACNSHIKAGPTSDTRSFTELICEVHDQILLGDNTLETYVIDGRRAPGTTAPLVMPVHSAPTQTTTTEYEEPNRGRTLQVNLATVPRKELAERYVHRNIHGVSDFKVFDHARANSINVLIYGPTGPGKTTSVEAWAAERGLRMATISGNASMEPSQMTGKFISDGHGGFIWIDGPVTDVVRNGGVLLLDEVNFINPKIYTNLYSLTDGRRTITLLDHMGETIDAHPDVTVFATMNPEYIGTTPLNFAFRNRFDIQIPWDYDDSVESKLIPSKALLVLMKQLRIEAAKGQYETPISTNMGMEFCRFLPALGYEFAMENFIAHFGIDEAPSVRMVFQTHEYNLKLDFGLEVETTQEKEADNVSANEQLAQWAAQIPATV